MLTWQHVTATDPDAPTAPSSSLTHRPVTSQPNDWQAFLPSGEAQSLSTRVVSGFCQILTKITGIHYFPQNSRQCAPPSAWPCNSHLTYLQHSRLSHPCEIKAWTRKERLTYSSVSIQTCELYCSIVALPGIFLVLFVVPVGTVSVGQSVVCKINLEETERPMSNALSSKCMTFTIKS